MEAQLGILIEMGLNGELENVQKPAARFVMRSYSRETDQKNQNGKPSSYGGRIKGYYCSKVLRLSQISYS